MPGAQDMPGWGESALLAVAAWGVSRLVLGLVGGFSFLLDGQPVHWLAMWVQWDANYYLSIVNDGYALPTLVTGGETGQSNINFFPLLPLLTRGAMLLGPPAVPAALLVSNAALVAAAVAIHRLAVTRAGSAAGRWAVLSLMVLPGSFSLSGVMTESLFLAASAWAFLLAGGRRMGAAAAVGALLPVARITGVGLTAALGLDWLVARWRGQAASYRDLFLIMLTPVLLVGFMAYMHLRFGDGLAFVHSQFAFWQHRMGVPLQNFAMWAWTDQPRLWMQSVLATSMLLVLLSQVRRLHAGEILFVALNVVSFASSLSAGPSLLRYMLSLAPLHLAVGTFCASRGWGPTYLVLMALVNGALMPLWAHGSEAYI